MRRDNRTAFRKVSTISSCLSKENRLYALVETTLTLKVCLHTTNWLKATRFHLICLLHQIDSSIIISYLFYKVAIKTDPLTGAHRSQPPAFPSNDSHIKLNERESERTKIHRCHSTFFASLQVIKIYYSNLAITSAVMTTPRWYYGIIEIYDTQRNIISTGSGGLSENIIIKKNKKIEAKNAQPNIQHLYTISSSFEANGEMVSRKKAKMKRNVPQKNIIELSKPRKAGRYILSFLKTLACYRYKNPL